MVKSTTPNSTGKRSFRGKNHTKNTTKIFLLQAKVFFLTYKGGSKAGFRLTKKGLADFLLSNPNDRSIKPVSYLVSEQAYLSGEPHFHVILEYDKRKQVISPGYFDYQGVHPNIQTMRNMKAALQYVHKQDLEPLTNINIIQQKRKARAKDSSSLYQLLEQQMLKDPFRFNVYMYCQRYNLGKQIYKANYTKAIGLIHKMQEAQCKALLRNLPGIKLITPTLIQQKLDPAQLKQFYSQSCYQRIVDYVNIIHHYPNRDPQTRAPIKTPHLFLVGTSDLGKSALVNHRPHGQYVHPGLEHYYSVFTLGVAQRFYPPYCNYIFNLVFWNQFVVDSPLYPRRLNNQLLDYLDGAIGSLVQKGRSAYDRQDNPRHILTSNFTLQYHVSSAFKTQQTCAKVLVALRSRIIQVCIPDHCPLHFLRKLFVSCR